jgi:hypothetical protein
MTNKKNFTGQIGTTEARSRILRKHHPTNVRVAAAKQASQRSSKKRKRSSVNRKNRAALPFEADEPLPYTNPNDHFHISTQVRYAMHIGQFERENEGDPALEVSRHDGHMRLAYIQSRIFASILCITSPLVC